MLQLPAGYTIFGTSNNGNTLTAVKAAESTAAKPVLMVIDRTAPSYNQATGKFSVPVYRVRVIRGVLDADGNPKIERLMIDANIRTPVGTDAEHGTLLADFLAFVDQVDFVAGAVGDHLFPDEAPVV